MAANDEFPRGWVASSGVASGPATLSLTIPASPGIGHILTNADVTIASIVAQFVFFEVLVTDANGNVQLILPLTISAAATGEASGSWTGKIPAAVSGLLTVALTPNLIANTQGQMVIQGYDI